MNRMLVAAFLLATSSAGCASESGEARLNLRKWGLAYCLTQQHAEPSAREDAARAQGAYFQRGEHDDEAAYAHIRAFFDAQMKQAAIASSAGGKPLSLVGCLDIYESDAYRAKVKQQDAWLAPGP